MKENEVIEYTIKSACFEDKFVDGRGTYKSNCPCSRCLDYDIFESDLNKHYKRNRLQRQIREEKDLDF